MNRIVVLFPLAVICSLLSGPSLASAEIKAIPPSNWQPLPTNNSTSMQWFQNSTKSFFAIVNPDLDMIIPLYLMESAMAQSFADQGILESADKITFGHSNYGHRYFLNVSSRSDIANASSDTLINVKGFLDQMSGGREVSFKEMVIMSEKKGDLFAIVLLSPSVNFDSVFKQIKPTLDSIQLSNSTAN